ncbi:MAG: hypothetical protein IV086_01680 [Hyphomonadaceae bacterium]|nr:MAG: hypothetical protein FD160_1131 [Caulobacteraceae bacterium]MBT9444389.1 hypothetical protein [Hyphomonadaceae bacterium]TPW05655.1 MAG: hypothetical protein FD124_2079 [Alphaproteobacteria bacterium]
MAYDGALAPVFQHHTPGFQIGVTPNQFGRARWLEGDVKVQDRLALLFGYASVGAGAGIAAGMIAGVVQPALIPVLTIVTLTGSILLARQASRRLHWSAVVLLIALHLSAMAAAASALVPGETARLAPAAGVFAGVLVVLALGYGRWYTTTLNMAFQALLLGAPFGAAAVSTIFGLGVA